MDLMGFLRTGPELAGEISSLTFCMLFVSKEMLIESEKATMFLRLLEGSLFCSRDLFSFFFSFLFKWTLRTVHPPDSQTSVSCLEMRSGPASLQAHCMWDLALHPFFAFLLLLYLKLSFHCMIWTKAPPLRGESRSCQAASALLFCICAVPALVCPTICHNKVHIWMLKSSKRTDKKCTLYRFMSKVMQ